MSYELQGYLYVFLLTVILLPILKIVLIKLEHYDLPTEERKIHDRRVPSSGGISIMIAVTFGYFFFGIYKTDYLGIWIGGIIILILGLIDDVVNVSPKVKIIVEFFVACMVVYISNYVIKDPALALFSLHRLPFIYNLLSVVWILGVINATNLIDGLDGLATGIVIQILLGFSYYAVVDGDVIFKQMLFIFLMASIGFLLYNYYPAQLFLGDTGSLLLGYFISLLAVLGFARGVFSTILIPTMFLILPIVDTGLAIIRRYINSGKIFTPDRKHIHHQLIDHFGFHHKNAVLILYFLNSFVILGTIVFWNYSQIIGSIIFCIFFGFIIYIIEKTDIISENLSFKKLFDKFTNQLR